MLSKRYNAPAPAKAESDDSTLFDLLDRHVPGYFRKVGE